MNSTVYYNNFRTLFTSSTNINIDNFIKILYNTKSIVAGSFIIQSILYEDWKDSDIDIWVSDKIVYKSDGDVLYFNPIEPFYNLLKSNGYTMNILTKQNIENLDGYARLRDKITKIYTFSKGKDLKKIQIILTNYENITDCIYDFDIEACMVYYDPYNNKDNIKGIDDYLIQSEFRDLTTVDSIQQVIDKRTIISNSMIELNFIEEWIRTLTRIAKYCNRGFKIYWPNDIKENIQNHIKYLKEKESIYYVNFVDRWNNISYKNFKCRIPLINKFGKLTEDFRIPNINPHTSDIIKKIYITYKNKGFNLSKFSIDEKQYNFNKCNNEFEDFGDDLTSTSDYLNDNKHLIFIPPLSSKDIGKDINILCLSVKYLNMIFRNKWNTYFFECTTNNIQTINLDNIYIKIPIGARGDQGLVPFENLKHILTVSSKKTSVFYIIPNTQRKELKYTVSWRNVATDFPYYVSTNHCQDGSNLPLYEIVICDNPSICTFTNKNKGINGLKNQDLEIQNFDYTLDEFINFDWDNLGEGDGTNLSHSLDYENIYDTITEPFMDRTVTVNRDWNNNDSDELLFQEDDLMNSLFETQSPSSTQDFQEFVPTIPQPPYTTSSEFIPTIPQQPYTRSSEFIPTIPQQPLIRRNHDDSTDDEDMIIPFRRNNIRDIFQDDDFVENSSDNE